MTPLPPNADELVSAYLDGEAAPDEVRTVESTPELMARVEALRGLTAQLQATPIGPPPAQKEAHISAALDAFDTLFVAVGNPQTAESLTAVPSPPAAADGAPGSFVPTVTSLDAARHRHRPQRRRRFNTGMIAAAAAVVVLFVTAAALSFGFGNSSDQVATDALDVAAAADSGDDTTSADEAMADEPTGPMLSELEPSDTDRATAVPESAAALRAPEADAAGAAEVTAEDLAPADEEAADEEAADEGAMAEAEEAAEDAEQDFAVAADDAAADGDGMAIYALGNFLDRSALKAGLADVSITELLTTSTQVGSGVSLPCQTEIPELIDADPDQVLAEAFIEDEGLLLAEIFVLTNTDRTRDVYVLDSIDCTVITVLEDQS